MMANTGGVTPRNRGKKARPFRLKRRSWLFKIERVTNHDITGADLLSLVCRRYSTVKKLVVKPAPAETERNTDAAPREGAAVSVQIRFAGPQPSESCGALLCLLLGGDSVQARPVELPRGRKRKYSMSAEANDDVNPADAPAGSAAAGLAAGNIVAGVPGVLPPPPRRGESYDEDDVTPQRPPDRRQHGQQPPPHLRGGMRLDQRQQPAAGRHGAVSDPEPAPFPAAQPPHGARGAAGGARFGAAAGPSSSAPGGRSSHSARSGSVGGGRGGGGGGAMLLLPMEDVLVEPSRKDCDMEGRPFPAARMAGGGAPAASGPADDRQCHLVFTGLQETGHDLNSLRVTALFGVDAVHQTATMSGPLQVGADGRVYSSLFYPSLQEIWPELYAMRNIPVVEVDIEVEILSDSGGEYRYHGFQLKVVYHRAAPPANGNVVVAAPGQAARGPSGRPMPPRSSGSHPPGVGDGEFRPIYPLPDVDG